MSPYSNKQNNNKQKKYKPICLNVDANQRAHTSHYPSLSLTPLHLSVCRSSRAVLQPHVVPQPGPRPLLHSSDRLGQRPLHSAMGPEEAVHPGSLRGDTDRSGSVSERIADG
ncbi:hypothetical protein EYF80_066035 [Liparis tanakae]|uniref:Uncharacterized protein n=1 Tax=Liparis tanakae TaxID=230148 RepID=A0A4Z2E5B2_9TELE|nr:hypothetical protein EYF80_066035 [Liparis tanakae]